MAWKEKMVVRSRSGRVMDEREREEKKGGRELKVQKGEKS